MSPSCIEGGFLLLANVISSSGAAKKLRPRLGVRLIGKGSAPPGLNPKLSGSSVAQELSQVGIVHSASQLSTKSPYGSSHINLTSLCGILQISISGEDRGMEKSEVIAAVCSALSDDAAHSAATVLKSITRLRLRKPLSDDMEL